MHSVRGGTVAFLILALAACAPPTGELQAQEPPPGERPPLAVVVVVDQLRGDLLERYDAHFTGGFRRLLDQGRVFPNATHDHLFTETAPGHATLSTGTHPSRHGVVSNQWFEERNQRWEAVENVIDPSTRSVPDRSLPGASPVTLERSGLADWMRDADDDAKVVAVSGKPRGAVLLAGKTKGQVYWFEPLAGAFMTSTWYRRDEAGWVEEFNEKVLPGFAADSVWESTVPPEAALLSRPDTAAGEGDGTHTWFPHRFDQESEDFWWWFSTLPALDRATLMMARRAIEGEDLGEDDVTDLLTVSLSAADRVGHAYGPLSREQLDNLLRLDLELGRFFDHLDRTVGQGRWVVAFSADHGAQDTPEGEREQGVAAVRLTRDSLASLQKVVDQAARQAGGTGASVLARPLARGVVELPWIARAWTHASLRTGEPADSFEVLARNSFHPERAGGLLSRVGVEYMLEPHVLPFGYPTGTTHQTGYYHDRHVPFILMGAGVEPGEDPTRVSTTDFAPTLAALIGVRVPDDLDGVARPAR